MGARIEFAFKQDESENYITLYSHWGADNWEIDLAYALESARPRWSDPYYGTRIVISNLIGEQWKEETGFGLFITNANEDRSDSWAEQVIVDFVKKEVNGTPFDTLVKYGIAKEEYKNA